MAAGERPAGTSFWGESVPVEIAVNIAGTPLGETYDAAISTRGTNGAILDHAPMVSGNSFSAWMRPRLQYLLPGDAATVVWVIEVLSGSGTLHLSDGRSAPSDTPTGVPPNDLGAQTISGPGTYLWDSTSSLADLLTTDFSRAWVQVECTSGTVNVQQVKLRVWPPTGPLGGLDGAVEARDQTWASADTSRVGWPYSETSTSGDYDGTWYAAFAAMQAAAAAHPAEGDAKPNSSTFPSVSSYYTTRSTVDFDGTTYSTVVESATGDLFLMRSADDDLTAKRISSIPGFEGVDYIADPNEVWIDPTAYVHLDEPIVVDWDVVMDFTPALPISPAAEASGQVLTHTGISLIDDTEQEWSIFTDYPSVGPVVGSYIITDYRESDPEAYVTHSTDLAVPRGVIRLRVQARHEYQTGTIPPPHGVNYFGGSRSAEASVNVILRATHMTGSSFSTPGYYYTRPAFKFWVPADVKKILPLRQFPRNDGLRGGPAGLTPSSRQAGRLSGYL